jgi:hypothetical protein
MLYTLEPDCLAVGPLTLAQASSFAKIQAVVLSRIRSFKHAACLISTVAAPQQAGMGVSLLCQSFFVFLVQLCQCFLDLGWYPDRLVRAI